jgi:recombination protein RecA
VGDLLDIGVEAGIIDKSGAWYSFNGERIGQGRENVKTFLTDNPDLFADLNEKVRQTVGLGIKSETDAAAPKEKE